MPKPEDIAAERARVRRLLAPDYFRPTRPPEQPHTGLEPAEGTTEPSGSDTGLDEAVQPLRPGEPVEANSEGIARLLALQRAGLMGTPATRRERVKPRRTPKKPVSEPTMLRNFD